MITIIFGLRIVMIYYILLSFGGLPLFLPLHTHPAPHFPGPCQTSTAIASAVGRASAGGGVVLGFNYLGLRCILNVTSTVAKFRNWLVVQTFFSIIYGGIIIPTD